MNHQKINNLAKSSHGWLNLFPPYVYTSPCCGARAHRNASRMLGQKADQSFFVTSRTCLKPTEAVHVKGVTWEALITAQTPFQWSRLWNQLFTKLSGLTGSPEALTSTCAARRSCPLPSNLPQSPLFPPSSFLSSVSSLGAIRDDSWPLTNTTGSRVEVKAILYLLCSPVKCLYCIPGSQKKNRQAHKFCRRN